MPTPSLDFSLPVSLSIAYGTVTVGGSVNGSFQVAIPSPGGMTPDEKITITAINISGVGAAAYSEGSPSIVGIILKKANPFVNGVIKFTPPSAAVFNATFNVGYNSFNTSQGTIAAVTAHSVTLSGTGKAASGGGGGVGEVPGVVQSFRRELVPVNSQSAGIVLAYFDETNFNDAIDARSYVFKAEDILADRVPTVRRVIVTYVDLGVATVTAIVSGVDDTGASVSTSATVVLGTAGATGRLMTAFFDMEISCFRPQLTLSQTANGGPFQMSTALMVGTVEKEVTL